MDELAPWLKLDLETRYVSAGERLLSFVAKDQVC